VRTGKHRKAKRRRRVGSEWGWPSIVQKDLSHIFTDFHHKEPGKHTRRKIKAGRLVSRNEGMFAFAFDQAAGAVKESGTQVPTPGQADESPERRDLQMSETTGPILYHRSGEFK